MRGLRRIVVLLLGIITTAQVGFFVQPQTAQAADWKWSNETANYWCGDVSQIDLWTDEMIAELEGDLSKLDICGKYLGGLYKGGPGDAAFAGITGPSDAKFKEVRVSQLTWADLDKQKFCQNFRGNANYTTQCTGIADPPASGGATKIYGIAADTDPDGTVFCKMFPSKFCQSPVNVPQVYKQLIAGEKPADYHKIRRSVLASFFGLPKTSIGLAGPVPDTVFPGYDDDVNIWGGTQGDKGNGTQLKMEAIRLWLNFSALTAPDPTPTGGVSKNYYYTVKDDGQLKLGEKTPNKTSGAKHSNLFYSADLPMDGISFNWNSIVDWASAEGTVAGPRCGPAGKIEGGSGVAHFDCFKLYRDTLWNHIMGMHKLLVVAGIEKPDGSGDYLRDTTGEYTFEAVTDAISGRNRWTLSLTQTQIEVNDLSSGKFKKIGGRLPTSFFVDCTNSSLSHPDQQCLFEQFVDTADNFQNKWPDDTIGRESYAGDDLAETSTTTHSPMYRFAQYYAKEPMTTTFFDNIDTSNATGSTVQAGGSRCGIGAGITEIGKAIAIALCTLVDIGQSWSKELLQFSVGLMGDTANISGFRQGTASWVPKELTGSLQSLFVDSDNSFAASLRTLSGVIRSLLNAAVILLFLVVALATITQVDVKTYTIKKLVPGIVIGFIVSQFSLFFVRVGLELADQAAGAVIEAGLDSGESITGSYESSLVTLVDDNVTPMTDDGTSTGNVDISKVMQQGVRNLFIFAAGVMIFMLGFLFITRSVVFFFLAPLAPLAFFTAFVPPLSNLWKRWSKLFFSWLFMPVVSCVWLWLGFKWIEAVQPVGSDQGFFGISFIYLLTYFFAMLCIYFALRTPFSMAGEAGQLLNKWNALGKKAWGSTGGKVTGAASKAGKTALDATKKFAIDEARWRTMNLRRWTGTSKPVSAWREMKAKREHNISDEEAIMKSINKDNFDLVQSKKYIKAQQDLEKKAMLAREKGDLEALREVEKDMKKLANKGVNKRNMRTLARLSTWHEEDESTAKSKAALKGRVEVDLMHNSKHHRELVEELQDIDNYRQEVENANNEAVRAYLYGEKGLDGKSKGVIVLDEHGNYKKEIKEGVFDAQKKPVMETYTDPVTGQVRQRQKTTTSYEAVDLDDPALATMMRNARKYRAQAIAGVHKSQAGKDNFAELMRLVRTTNGIEPNKNMHDDYGNKFTRKLQYKDLSGELHTESDEEFELRKEIFKRARGDLNDAMNARARSEGGADVKAWDQSNYRMLLVKNDVPDATRRTDLKDMMDGGADVLKVDLLMDRVTSPETVARSAHEMAEALIYAHGSAIKDPSHEYHDAYAALNEIYRHVTKDATEDVTDQTVRQKVRDWHNTKVGQQLMEYRNGAHKMLMTEDRDNHVRPATERQYGREQGTLGDFKVFDP